MATSSAATRGQLPLAHVSFLPPAVMLSLPWQYEAAANCSKSWRSAKVMGSIAVLMSVTRGIWGKTLVCVDIPLRSSGAARE